MKSAISVGRVLAVGVHRQRVREAGRARSAQAVQHRRALARVARQHAAPAGPGRRRPVARRPSRACRRCCRRPPPTPGSTARAPRAPCRTPGAGVVARDQHQVRASTRCGSMHAAVATAVTGAQRQRSAKYARSAAAAPGGRPRARSARPSRSANHDRQRRRAPDRPALAEVGRIGLDDDGLDRHLRQVRDQRDAGPKRVDRRARPCACLRGTAPAARPRAGSPRRCGSCRAAGRCGCSAPGARRRRERGCASGSAFMMQTPRGTRATTSSASSMLGWLAAMIRPPRSWRSASSALAVDAHQAEPLRAGPEAAVDRRDRGAADRPAPCRRGSSGYSTRQTRFQPSDITPRWSSST